MSRRIDYVEWRPNIAVHSKFLSLKHFVCVESCFSLLGYIIFVLIIVPYAHASIVVKGGAHLPLSIGPPTHPTVLSLLVLITLDAASQLYLCLTLTHPHQSQFIR